MNLNFDMQCDSKSFISDKEWDFILESSRILKSGKSNFVVYKNHIIKFHVKNNIVYLLGKERCPVKNYKLPFITLGMCFDKRVAVYKEERRLMRSVCIDSENFLKYGA